jgi:hydroxymethylpyrimidine kinase/phosphomethylpyrimidine kinase/thiamine-phosphate diphosphorylase
MKTKKPIIWSVSGSDCSGGAGIAADIKTGHSLGVEVCTLITANTVQSSTELISINPVPIEILQQQVNVLIMDKPPSVIKIGLLATVEQVIWLTSTLVKLKQALSNLIVVYDPVGQASVGGCFNTFSLTDLAPLLQQIDVITPNMIEATVLVDISLKMENKQLSAEMLAKEIYQLFSINSVIIKGGHNSDSEQCTDFCLHQLNQLKQDNQDKNHQAICYQLSSSRISSSYSHGGGCSFASALASFLALGYLVRDAFTLTKAFINQGLIATQAVSSAQHHNYYGAFEQLAWPPASTGTTNNFPQVVDKLNQQYQNLPAFNPLNLQDEKLGLYPVIDSLYWLKRLLPLGLKIIQLRVKNLPVNKLDQVISEAVKLAKDYDTRLFINDYWQLAIRHNAYGVHIGQEDLCNADLVKIQQAGLRLGISTHGCYEFLLAQQLQPSYLAVGAVFPTKTKDMTGQIQGLGNLSQILALRTQQLEQTVPVVAIGGINLVRAPAVLATGVESIAVVTAITNAEQLSGKTPEQAVSQFLQLIG